jgi:hypothetical protein
MKYLFILLVSFSILYSCGNKKENDQNTTLLHDENPAANGFNAEGSDQKAIDIADQVMQAMGGRKNWDDERFFKWNFFGSRTLWWDKLKGDVRIQMHKSDSTVILVNIYDGSGKVFLNGSETSHPDSLSKYLKRGKGIWINDAYWLFMPFKLKDTGVTLNYIGEDTTQTGIAAHKLQLTFDNVGNTPQNKYNVWVDKSDDLVKQWAFFRENNMEEPNFINPWAGYEKYGSLLLSGDRGRRKISDIEVPDQMDASIFFEL